MVKTRLIWSRIDENTSVTDEELERALKGAEDLFGKKFYILYEISYYYQLRDL